MLANLLARQVNLVGRIEFDIPNVAMKPRIAHFGEQSTLVPTLCAVVDAGFPGTVETGSPQATPAFEITLGEHPTARVPATTVVGLGWRVCVGREAQEVDPTDDANPVGPYFAACLAAGEVFKHLRGLLPGAGSMLSDFGLSLWDYTEGKWSELSPGPAAFALALPSSYIIGLGAVGQAASAVFAAYPELMGHLTLVDKDTTDGTNLNRYALSTNADIGSDKVDVVAERFSNSGLTIFAAPVLWQDYAIDSRHRTGQRPELHTEEVAFRYHHVLSCVDKNAARHAIQNFWPRTLWGGSTNGLSLAVAAYDATTDYECLKCHNPLEPVRPSIEKLAETLRQLSVEERAKGALEVGADIAAIEQYLKSPQCGSLGEGEVLKFDTSRIPDWSVGFVSVASGVILAAEFIKASAGTASVPNTKGNTIGYSFLSGVFRTSRHARRRDCDCAGKGLEYFRSLWCQRA